MSPVPDTISPESRAAFTRFYASLHEPFARYCAGRCLGSDAIEDVMQDAILSALERWDEFPPALRERRLLGYMIGIVDNQLRNRLRARAVEQRFLAQRTRELGRRLPNDPAAAVDLDLILRAIDRLPPTQGEALLLHAVSGFSIREVADAQGVSEGAVRTRVHRARTTLRARLAERRTVDGHQRATTPTLSARLHTLTLLLLL